jgi:large subunit ribosomal protein L39
MQKTFKAEAELQLHSFPYPSVRSGSFIHDICLKEPNWEPTEQELRTLGAEMIKLASRDVKLERLEVPHEVALEMFRDNPFKREQLPSISNQNKGIVTLYRVEDHIDISRGPMVGSTRYLSRAHISSVHKLTEGICNLYRVQGVSLPIGFSMNAFAFSILTERAKKLVSDFASDKF